MANKAYIKKLEQVILDLHHVNPTWSQTVPVNEKYRGHTIWKGSVEVFNLKDHEKAKRCYAWSYRKGSEEKFTVMLEIPPVDSAITAVRVSIMESEKEKKDPQ